MARPIKETPVLKGKDADRFITAISKSENIKISQTTRKRMESNYKVFCNAAKFK